MLPNVWASQPGKIVAKGRYFIVRYNANKLALVNFTLEGFGSTSKVKRYGSWVQSLKLGADKKFTYYKANCQASYGCNYPAVQLKTTSKPESPLESSPRQFGLWS